MSHPMSRDEHTIQETVACDQCDQPKQHPDGPCGVCEVAA